MTCELSHADPADLGADSPDPLSPARVAAAPASMSLASVPAAETLVLDGSPRSVADDSGCGELVGAAEGGMLVPYGEAEALAGAIRVLLEDREHRESGENGTDQHPVENLQCTFDTPSDQENNDAGEKRDDPDEVDDIGLPRTCELAGDEKED